MTYTDELKTKFNNHFPVVLKRLVDHSEGPKSTLIPSQIDWAIKRLETSLEYNVPFGKQTRGMTVVKSFYALNQNKDYDSDTEETLFNLGWAIELLQASFLVADDVMDQSTTRRGKPCWYRNPDIGLSAINDAFLMESCVFSMLKISCKNHPFYLDLVDLFHTTILNTQIGQTMDIAVTSKPPGEFVSFTEEHYMTTITYKTSFYSFCLPVAVALYVSGINDERLHKKVSDVLMKIGQLFQIQDDFLDCFGEPEVTGKIGTDIEENKCTWLIVEALKIAKEDDLQKLQSHYGRDNLESSKIVKSVFTSLGIKERFINYETEMYQKLLCEIEDLKEDRLPKSIFLDLLNKIYQRKK